MAWRFDARRRRLGRARRPRRARHRPRALPRRRDRRRCRGVARRRSQPGPRRSTTRVRVDRRVRERRDRHDRGVALRARPQERASRWEINGSKGSLAFDLERLNELAGHSSDGDDAGFRTVLVSEADHPFWSTGGRTAT